MILLKTAAGQQAFKERHGALSLRQRSAFLLFDGQRSLAQVLEATAALGISWDDVRNMVDAGLLELNGVNSYSGATNIQGFKIKQLAPGQAPAPGAMPLNPAAGAAAAPAAGGSGR